MNNEMHIKNLPSRRKKRRIRLASRIVFVAAVIVLLISGFQLARIFIGYHRADSSYNDIRDQIVSYNIDETSEDTSFHFDNEALLALHEEYPEIVGWMIIDGTDINYPIMHRPGNEGNSYYLTHDYTGGGSANGSIFIDTSNDPYLRDAHTLIYGHNMKSGAMFADLLDYRDEDFALTHTVVKVWMIDETNEHVRALTYSVISSHSTMPDSSIYTLYFDTTIDSSAMTQYTANILGLSDHEYEVPDERGPIITLSTCIGDTTRYVLHCTLVTEDFN